ncbi:coiled-coil domain-containing protein 9 isoform X1 [Lates japonicus]|uniref:Coiled-coil domain-containing protein 9 isoform X1 n=1 Tax=Lates japonicus TaxID=270547 RepID=A0AAD3R295_LATJO|nr:coiled-coil domain-containing protein 9 isoform X1 [Lates japonicus]
MCFILKGFSGNCFFNLDGLDNGPIQLMPGKTSLSSVCPVRREDSAGSGSFTFPRTRHQRLRRRDPSSCPAVQTASRTRTRTRRRGETWRGEEGGGLLALLSGLK